MVDADRRAGEGWVCADGRFDARLRCERDDAGAGRPWAPLDRSAGPGRRLGATGGAERCGLVDDEDDGDVATRARHSDAEHCTDERGGGAESKDERAAPLPRCDAAAATRQPQLPDRQHQDGADDERQEAALTPPNLARSRRALWHRQLSDWGDERLRRIGVDGDEATGRPVGCDGPEPGDVRNRNRIAGSDPLVCPARSVDEGRGCRRHGQWLTDS